MFQQLRRADDESCERDLAVWMDCKHDIYAMLLRVNFTRRHREDTDEVDDQAKDAGMGTTRKN